MEKTDRHGSVTAAKTRTTQAEARTKQAETRTAQAKTRAELAETRTEQAETRTESAKTRAEQAETRTEQAESRTEQAEATLERVLHEKIHLLPEASARRFNKLPLTAITDRDGSLNRLTKRQREVLRLIAEGRNTKQIGEVLKVSPKTVEYHRMKLMAGLDVHDIAGLVRVALRAGLIPPES
ncbi:MAG TPA: LuxR C-terminal-related transcriptional regulator [Candidatus Saccharimonadales bacterium]|nr:LuxR C-terminal-related transcriptional regulator [Candidatus Saccharimonadales bacterium]